MEVRYPHRLTNTSTRREILENLFALDDVLMHGIETANNAYGTEALLKDADTSEPHNLSAAHSVQPYIACISTVTSQTCGRWTTIGHSNVTESAVFLFASSCWNDAAPGGGNNLFRIRGQRTGGGALLTFHSHDVGTAYLESTAFYTAPVAGSIQGLDGMYANNADPALVQDFNVGAPGIMTTVCAVAWVKRHVGLSM